MKTRAQLSIAARFFYKYGAYSYRPDELPETGRIRCAIAAADAEQHLLQTTRNHCDNDTKVARLFERSFERDELSRKAAAFLHEVDEARLVHVAR